MPPAPPKPPARRPPWAALASVLLASQLVGCATVAPADPAPSATGAAVAGPAWAHADGLATATAVDDALLAQWWRQFDDPALGQMVADALAAHPDLRSAQADLAQARAARALAEAARWPAVGLGASSGRTASESAGANTHRLAFSASWEPDLNGNLSAAVAAARADEDAAQADAASTRIALAAEVALAYVQWRGALAREQLTRASLTALEDTLQLTEWRTRAGLASALDLEQALLATEQTRASLPTLATEIAQYEHQIAVLRGLAPARGRPTRAGADNTLTTVPQAPAALRSLAVGVPADLLRRRPDLRAAEARVQAAWAREVQSRRAAWPGLSLTGSLGWQAATLGALGGPGAALASLAAGVDWTVFDAGAREAQVAGRSAALAQARAAYEAGVLTALQDVEDSLVALRGSRDRADALARAEQAAAAALLAQRIRHQAGVVDTATWLNAQRDELAARLALQTTRTETSLQLIRLFKALGGGWSAPTDSTDPGDPDMPAPDRGAA